MSISLVSSILNESENLVRMVENVKSFIDEWVVLDTGSTDGSQQLARSLGARVYEFPTVCCLGGYAHMRTLGLHLCRSDYALIMDGDERFLPDALGMLKQFGDSPNHDIIWLPRKNYTSWDMSSWDNPPGHDDYQPKFVRTKVSIYWTRPVHEWIQGIQGEYKNPNNPMIRHFGAMKHPARLAQVSEICGYLERNEHYPAPAPIVPYWKEGRVGLA